MTRTNPTILQIIPNLDTGGAERTVVDIVDALVTAGARALVATQSGQLVSEVERLGGEILYLPVATKNPLKICANIRRLQKLIENEKVDLVHARSRAPAWSAMLAARARKVPFVTTYHGAYTQQNRLKGFYNSVMARGDVVIANSNYTADHLINARHGTPKDRLRIIYRGINTVGLRRENIPSDRTDKLRSEWKLAEDVPIIVQAGRLSRRKGQLITVQALGRSKQTEAVLVLVGEHRGHDDYIQEIKDVAAGLGIADRVQLPGHCTDIAAAYAIADLAIVAPIEPEAFGRTAAESQVTSIPTIATRIGAPQEIVLAPPQFPETQRTGWLVEPGNVDELASAIDEAISLTPVERANLAQRARNNVETRFSLKQMQSQTLAVYNELLGSSLSIGT